MSVYVYGRLESKNKEGVWEAKVLFDRTPFCVYTENSMFSLLMGKRNTLFDPSVARTIVDNGYTVTLPVSVITEFDYEDVIECKDQQGENRFTTTYRELFGGEEWSRFLLTLKESKCERLVFWIGPAEAFQNK